MSIFAKKPNKILKCNKKKHKLKLVSQLFYLKFFFIILTVFVHTTYKLLLFTSFKNTCSEHTHTQKNID